jgi:uncharacterized protein YdiU (UPF0061 family)
MAGDALDPVRDLFLDRAAFDAWMLLFLEQTNAIGRAEMADLMLKTNPAYVLRNHLGELAIRAAKQKDYAELENLLSLLQNPFVEMPGMDSYASFPPDWASGIEISCSS